MTGASERARAEQVRQHLQAMEHDPALVEAAAEYCRRQGWLVTNTATTFDLAHAPLTAIAEALRIQPDMHRKTLGALVAAYVATRVHPEQRQPLTEADLAPLDEVKRAMVANGRTPDWEVLREAVVRRRLTPLEVEIVRLLWLFDMRDDARSLMDGLNWVLQAMQENEWFGYVLALLLHLYAVLWGGTDEQVRDVGRNFWKRLLREMLFVFAHYEESFAPCTRDVSAWRRPDRSAWRTQADSGQASLLAPNPAVWKDAWTPRRDALSGLLRVT